MMMINGTGLQQNYGEAMSICRGAANRHSARAEYCLGYLYQRGLGVAPDPKQAAKWYGEAAVGGHARAALTLAEMYTKGEGVAVDRPEAFCFLFFAYRNGAVAAKAQAHALRLEMSRDETKQLEKKLRERRLDPQKVFAIVDDPASSDRMHKVLTPVEK